MQTYSTRFLGGFLCLALCLGGCASGATAQGMTVNGADVKTAARADMANAVDVGDVKGGKESGFMSQVASDEFRAALIHSLENAGFLAKQPSARFRVKVAILSFRQPLVGVNMTVTSNIRYTVTDTKTNAVVFDEQIAAPYTATMGDSILGEKRLRIANEGAARASIQSLIAKLNAAAPGVQVAAK